MRISPLGIFGAGHNVKQVAEWARQDAALTHPNPVCLQANALFAAAIARAVQTGCTPETLYSSILLWAHEWNVEPALLHAVEQAVHAPPIDFVAQQGWVLIAFQNALWQLLHAPSLEEGVVGTVMRGGDTDTNAAICGALLGAVHGRSAVPAQWQDCVLNCRPDAGRPGVHRPRPACFWPVDALELAARLLGA
jgi:ADP-ribosylglycohydrolase